MPPSIPSDSQPPIKRHADMANPTPRNIRRTESVAVPFTANPWGRRYETRAYRSLQTGPIAQSETRAQNVWRRISGVSVS